MSKSGKDISTMYTKEKNNCGRRGYYRFKKEKITNISPKEYGMFLQGKKHK